MSHQKTLSLKEVESILKNWSDHKVDISTFDIKLLPFDFDEQTD